MGQDYIVLFYGEVVQAVLYGILEEPREEFVCYAQVSFALTFNTVMLETAIVL